MEALVGKIKGYLWLFLTMLKIGLFTFGGGYAMIALLENEFVEKKKWLEKDEFLDVTAIAESTPGPIAINAATYMGYKNAGIIGSIIATLGICIPSFVIIYAISLFFDAFLSLTLVEYAFKGIQICVVYLILTAGLKMLKQMKKTVFNMIIISITLICMVVFSLFAVKFSTIFYILISGICGVVVYLLGKIRKEKKHDLS
ncbi:MAG: chromate transporter [Ruminococcaceae bacterium]|nr:chromate transporter [Oscillospiraceae bacterium]